jgi:ectoine hydroxylase-related dioxygenase (phytanoyl-CoA dioxygenase family)
MLDIKQEFLSQGFVILKDHFDANNTLRAFEEVKPFIDTFANDLEIRYPHLLGLKKEFEWLLHLVMDPVHDLMGPVVNLSDVEIVTLKPGAKGLNPHIDHPYVLMDKTFADPILSLQTIWVLNDLTEENGATTAVPGSHLRCAWPDNSFYSESQKILAQAGDVIMMHGGLWHATAPNLSQQDRSNLLITFVPPWVQPLSKVDKNYTEIPTNLMRELLGLNNLKFLRDNLRYKQGAHYRKI